jgi:hypothetical protein
MKPILGLPSKQEIRDRTARGTADLLATGPTRGRRLTDYGDAGLSGMFVLPEVESVVSEH